MVDSWTDITDEQRQAVQDEFISSDISSESLLCPNLTEFEVSAMHGIGDGKTENLNLDLQLKNLAWLDDGFLILYSGETSRYFNAENYEN